MLRLYQKLISIDGYYFTKMVLWENVHTPEAINYIDSPGKFLFDIVRNARACMHNSTAGY